MKGNRDTGRTRQLHSLKIPRIQLQGTRERKSGTGGAGVAVVVLVVVVAVLEEMAVVVTVIQTSLLPFYVRSM
ncbi:hypothetical protein E2C01_012781 [Portunus trituberculatus]|uniref:Uncharacterized protein n=1 Tax=Portunus trituberculatus TaxID=210409 RepID=A0A5B7DEK9_PORTR|nr:hypothetical protein [Portunus trituberculatus]